MVAALIARRRWILVGLGGGIALTLFAFSALPSAFIPEEDQGYGMGIFQLQNGASLSQTQATALEVAKVLNAEEEIIAGSVVSGYGFNGSSPDQGVFFFGFKPLEERSGTDQKAPAIVNRLNAKLSQISSGMAVAAQPPAIPGFSAQGGFYFQFNDLSNGAYSFNPLNDQAKQLIQAGTSSGGFSTLYTQFIPSAPAFGLKIDRSILGALNVDFQQAMQTIAVLAGSNPVRGCWRRSTTASIWLSRRLRKARASGPGAWASAPSTGGGKSGSPTIATSAPRIPTDWSTHSQP
jgi:multidrug efflux pump subunit AcrB